MNPPALFTFLGPTLHQRITSPQSFGSRAWIMGVTAVQVNIESGRVMAHVRSHSTGGRTPLPVPLASEDLVHVFLAPAEGPLPALPHVAPPALDGAQARVSVFEEGIFRATAALTKSQLGSFPAPRAFAHVFCRWLRDEPFEAGFDLTDFVSQTEGHKYERILSRPLEVGRVVSLGFAAVD
jgi:hypothetical protein